MKKVFLPSITKLCLVVNQIHMFQLKKQKNLLKKYNDNYNYAITLLSAL